MLRHVFCIALMLSLGSCSPPRRDILVSWKGNQLVIDFPWSFWRLLGRQDRTYCVETLAITDDRDVLWKLSKVRTQYSCTDVAMPITIGEAPPGFVSNGRPQLKARSLYAVRISGIGHGTVDFWFDKVGEPVANETQWQKLMRTPCDTRTRAC